MENIERNVRTSFYLRLVSFVKLQNMQDNTEIVLYSNTSSPWFNQTDEAKNVCNDRKSFVWTLPILKDQALNGCLLFFSMLTSRLFWTGSRCWEQAPCKIGCGILPTQDRWWRWIPSTITCASGAAFLFIKVASLIEAKKLQDSLLYVFWNLFH